MRNSFKQGEHICSLYETEEEQLSMAAEYMADGLRRGERCLYVGESIEALEQFRIALRRFAVDAGTMIGQGALILSTNAEAHLVDGHFDSERMLGLLNQTLEAALKDGYTGLRTCGDMSWLLTDAP